MANSHNKPFEPIHNPYIVGNPIRGRKMFFGRQDDFAYIKTKITGEKEGGLIVLCGARRSGKTSILFQIQDGRLGKGFLPVLVDMQSMSIRSDEDFLKKIADAITSSRFGPDISDVEAFSVEEAADPYEAFERFITMLSDKLGDKKLVLTFDEYELLETHFDNNKLSVQVLRLLRALIEHKKLFVVFTGSDKLEARNKKYWDILAMGLNRRISFLTPKDTLALIREPLEGVIEYDEGVPEAMAELTAGQPFYTQVLCQTIVDHLNDRQKYDVTEEDLERVVDEVIVNPLPQMIFHWKTLPVLEKLCLSVIAEMNRSDLAPVSAVQIAEFMQRENLGYRYDFNALKKTLENLFTGQLLDKSADEDTYKFKMGLWRLWITRMHSVWQVIDEMERASEIPPELMRVEQQKGRKWIYVAATVVIVAAAAYALRGGFLGRSDAPTGETLGPSTATATIDIDSKPTNAEVWIDGDRIGLTPFDGKVEPGFHHLKIVQQGYRAFEDSFGVAQSGVFDTTLTLEELKGSIAVRSTPSGAQIWLNGENTGLRTPNELADLSVNMTHTVELDMSGYRRYAFPPNTVLADSIIVLSRDLSKRTAPLTIRSQPPEASFVLSDGKWSGTTPHPITDVEHGPHRLRVTKAGYEVWERTIEVPYPNNEIVVDLVKLPNGYIEFKIDPVANVWVDGDLMLQEITYRVVPIAPGEYVIELRSGEKNHSLTVTVKPSETLTIQHSFRDQ